MKLDSYQTTNNERIPLLHFTKEQFQKSPMEKFNQNNMKALTGLFAKSLFAILFFLGSVFAVQAQQNVTFNGSDGTEAGTDGQFNLY